MTPWTAYYWGYLSEAELKLPVAVLDGIASMRNAENMKIMIQAFSWVGIGMVEYWDVVLTVRATWS